MSWNQEQTSTDSITYSEWNTMVSYILSSHFSGAHLWDSSSFNNKSLIWDSTLGKWKMKTSGSTGTASAAGGDQYVQYNDGGTNLGGDSAFTWRETTNTLRISGAISSACISSGKITVSDFWILGDTISGLRDPAYPSAAANRHYIDTISSNLDARITTPTLSGPLAGNIGSNYAYGISGLKYASSQAISGAWRMPIYRTGKPTASATWDGRMIMSSGSTGNKARIWVCVKNDDGSTYDWIMLAIGN